MATCPICCEKYTAEQRKPIKCGKCDADACAACVRRYLVSQTDLSCMTCRKPWERTALVGVLPKSFVHGGLTKWRKEVLFERERGMMPATVPLVAAKRALRDLQLRLTAARVAARQARTACATSMVELRSRALQGVGLADERVAFLLERAALYGPAFTADTLTPETAAAYYTEYLAHVYRLEDFYQHMLAYSTTASRSIHEGTAPITWEEYQANMEEAFNPDAPRTGRPETAKYTATYIRPCPVADCRGFLSAQTCACGVCEAKVCKQCHELLGDDAAAHECHPDNVASAKLILKDTRACPKCAVRIFKIDGCDQMWCSACHTAFSWRTGEIETRRVHNPHYYEWMRRTNGAVPREPGDAPGGCDDGPPNYYDVNAWIAAVVPQTGRHIYRRYRNALLDDDPLTALGNTVSNLHQLMTHCHMVELPYYRPQDRHLLNHDLRIEYLENRVTEAEFKCELHKREKKYNKKQAIFQVVDMFVNVLADLFRNHMRTVTAASLEALRDEATALIAYSNKCFADVAAQYNNVTPRFRLGLRRDHEFVRFGHD